MIAKLRLLRNTARSALLLCTLATSAFSQDNQKALTTAVQLELNRLGCDAGEPDGLWGRGSKRALARYAEVIGETLDAEVTDSLLEKLRAERGRLCTLPPGVTAAADRSQTAHLEAEKYSYKVWSTLPAKVISKKTEYGMLRCVAGKNNGPRSCAWQ